MTESMSSIEELLVRDIDAVTSEVATAGSELSEARAELTRRIDGRRRQDRRVTVVAVAASAAVLVGVTAWQLLKPEQKDLAPVGPVTEQAFLTGDRPTTDQLLGVWTAHDRTLEPKILWKFTADGVVELAAGGNLTDLPVVTGTFELTDDAVAIEVDDEVTICGDKSWTLRAVVNQDGGLNVVPTDVNTADLCGIAVRPRWVLDQVLPVRDGAELLGRPSGDGWNPPSQREELLGTWQDPLAGSLVELRDDGTYSRLTGPAEVTDTGVWRVDDDLTRLTLVSGLASATCDEADQVVLGGLRLGVHGDLMLLGDVERDDCEAGLGGAGWILLAP